MFYENTRNELNVRKLFEKVHEYRNRWREQIFLLEQDSLPKGRIRIKLSDL